MTSLLLLACSAYTPDVTIDPDMATLAHVEFESPDPAVA